jgi:hypothetical protein
MVKRRYVKMTLIKPGTGRAQIQEQGSELRVTIPAKKLVHHFIFRCLARWLGYSFYFGYALGPSATPGANPTIAAAPRQTASQPVGMYGRLGSGGRNQLTRRFT